MKGYKIVLASDERYKNVPVRQVRLYSEWTEEEKKEWEKGRHVMTHFYTKEEKKEQLKRIKAIIKEYEKSYEEAYKDFEEDPDDWDGSYTDEEYLKILNSD